MTHLKPAPTELGNLHAPVLGPWFDLASVTLDAPTTGQLSIPLTLGAGGTVHWLPPASGVLSFFIAGSTPPAGLRRLRAADGWPAFSPGRLIALFRLLPGVEARLRELSKSLPTLAGSVAAQGSLTRPTIRWFALELDEPTPDPTFVDGLLPHTQNGINFGDFIYPADVDTTQKQVEHLGLSLESPNTLTNGSGPMSDLLRPGIFQNRGQALLRFTSSTNVRLWTFDARGFPVDPGAVAQWWNHLAVQSFDNLWASGLQTLQQRTAPITVGAEQLSVHLTDLHGGALLPAVEQRLDLTNFVGTGSVRQRGNEQGAAKLGFTDAPEDDPDDLPVPKVAVMPDGRLGDELDLWPDGALVPGLERDFARVVVASIEHHLVGQPRHAPDPALPDSDEQAVQVRRAEDQERQTTGLRVGRVERGALRTSIDTATAGVLDVFDGDGDTQLVTGVLERDWGVLTASLVDEPVPEAHPEITVQALVGGGEEIGGTVTSQRVLVTVSFEDAPAGTWVRVWSQGFDFETSLHVALDGGGGTVHTSDNVDLARMVVILPTGSVDADAQMGLKLVVVTARGHRFYSDLRFARPAPVGGSPIALGDAAGPVLVCETGVTLAAPPGPGTITSGAQLVALPTDAPAQLIDRASVPDNAFADSTLIRKLSSGDAVALTEPAFRKAPTGDDLAVYANSGATVTRVQRELTWTAGAPLPSMLRLELVATNVDESVGLAAIAGGPALGRSHESLPHRLGHPQCPASTEFHGTGVFLKGVATTAVAEYVRDRVAGSTLALIQAADTPLDTPETPSKDSLWAVGLRTVAAGVEMEIGLATLLDGNSGGFSPYPFDQTWQDIRDWVQTKVLTPLGQSMPSTNNIESIVRALDQRVLTAARGARGAATSLIAAIRRAQDLIYIETPALDDFEFGAEHDRLHFAKELRDRMDAAPGLHVVLCTSRGLSEGTPRSLERVRNDLLAQVLASLSGGGRDARIAHFQPSAGPGRSLRLATTTVVVDDCYVVSGTTHLWRRGLSFDSSYAVALTDDQFVDGRSHEIHQFRLEVLAGRLGLLTAQLPQDSQELVGAIKTLVTRGGLGRLAVGGIERRDPVEVTTNDPEVITEEEVWNPDGSAPASFDPVAFVAGLMIDVRQDELNPPTS